MKPQFKKGTIARTVAFGEVIESAGYYHVSGLFGIRKAKMDTWEVVHIPSGLSIGVLTNKLSEAKDAVHALLGLKGEGYDFTKDTIEGITGEYGNDDTPGRMPAKTQRLYKLTKELRTA